MYDRLLPEGRGEGGGRERGGRERGGRERRKCDMCVKTVFMDLCGAK